jgi:hypothetical protein
LRTARSGEGAAALPYFEKEKADKKRTADAAHTRCFRHEQPIDVCLAGCNVVGKPQVKMKINEKDG